MPTEAKQHSGELHTFIILLLFLMLFSSLAIYVLNSRGEQVFRYGPKERPTPTAVIQDKPVEASALATCDKEDLRFKVTHASEKGLCHLSFSPAGKSISGYSIEYPDSWQVRGAGAEGINLLFNEGKHTGVAQEVLVQLTSAKLTLEEADKATYGFETSEAIPLVDPDEKVVSRKIEEIDGTQTLRLTTSIDGETVLRYFLTHNEAGDETIYMIKTTGESDPMDDKVRGMIASFMPGKQETISNGRKNYKDKTLLYSFDYPDNGTVKVCSDLPCVSLEPYSIRIQDLNTYDKDPNIMASLLLNKDLFCDAGGPAGSVECKNVKVEQYVNSGGVAGYKVIRKRQITKIADTRTTVTNVDDHAFVFATGNKKYPSIMFAVDEVTADNLTVLDMIVESFSSPNL